uniref:Hispidin synthase n=1 Tax=Neonothopanus nambi TaxID=71958 RepID=HIPS_NEONM
MNSSKNPPSTLLDVFLDTARNLDTALRNVLECGEHRWSYRELDTVSSALAQHLRYTVGLSPTVAVISENHPYILALMLAVWKLGGTFAPIDVHSPAELVAGMLNIVSPSCLVIPSSDVTNQTLACDLNIPVVAFHPHQSTIPELNKKYLTDSQISPDLPFSDPNRPALYLFTSSATSRSNLKCVPLTHTFILRNSLSKRAWCKRMRPETDFDGIRVLGWAPWSHVLAHMQDIGPLTLLNAGCYVFATTPSTYPTELKDDRDLISCAANAIMYKGVKSFACLPFVLGGLKALCESEPSVKAHLQVEERAQLLKSLQHMEILECGGAMLEASVASWAIENCIPISIGIGMTETGGALFAGPVQAIKTGFSSEDKFIEDATYLLVKDDHESHAEEDINEGELVVKSKMLPRGYLGYSDPSFSVDDAGWVTFRTGDRYSVTPDGKFSWLGRNTDFIQMTSGETLDPRPIESSLCESSLISRACVIGDKFLNGPAAAVCAIIELEPTAVEKGQAHSREIARVFAPINRDLPPPLRIAWSHVLVLQPSEKIPMTKKGTIFRKKIEQVFGSALGGSSGDNSQATADAGVVRRDELSNTVKHIISRVLGVSDDELLWTLSFAELGMTSALATRIANELNEVLVGVNLPINACYIHVDLPSLSNAVYAKLAHLKLPDRTPEPRQAPVENSGGKEIVVVGQAFRLPGSINDVASLRDAFLARQASSIITEIPSDRWDHASFYPKDIRFNKAGLVDIANYDHSFFGLTATEALYLSPTMRLALEVSFEALENANIPVSQLKGSQTAVYVATTDDGFETLLNAEAGYDAYTRFYGTGRAASTASGRISCLLDVHGPSITVDTACSGGAVCIDQAIDYLQSSSAADTAIICASNTHCWPGSFRFLSAQGMVSPGGRCATFTTDADGYVPSEGAVAFILKTREAAMRDKDTILATIKATQISHNGRSQGLVAPNVNSQADLHRSLLQKAGLSPADIRFIEAHGTGTSLGDLSEIQAINDAYTSSQPRTTGPLIVSASKTVIGHTEPAGPLVGMLSVLNSFKEGAVPGLAHLTADNLNPSLDCSSVPLLIPYQPVHLAAPKPHRAAVRSYGFSGTLGGIVLEAPDEERLEEELPNDKPMLFVVSAKTHTALIEYLGRYLEFLLQANPQDFCDICYTSCVGREHYRYRYACVANDMEDLIGQLQKRLGSKVPPKPSYKRGALAFAFSGQGTQFRGMATELAKAYSGFRKIVSDLAKRASELSGHAIDRFLLAYDIGAENVAPDSEADQICIFVYQCSVLRWLQTMGIRPSAVIGHSLGEISASVAAGALSLDSALDLVISRARLLRSSASAPAGMAAMSASQDEVVELIGKLDLDKANSLSVSVINGPQNTVVSGSSAAIESIVALAKGRKIKASALNINQAFHSPYVDSAVPGLRAWSEKHISSARPLQIPLYSTLLGAQISEGEMLNPDHWVDHARKPVQFAQAATTMKESFTGVIIDIGPQVVAWSLLLSNGLTSVTALAAKRGRSQQVAFLSALADLYQDYGVVPDFVGLYAQQEDASRLKKTDILTYPFQRGEETLSSGSSTPTLENTDLDSGKELLMGPTRGLLRADDLRDSIVSSVKDVLELKSNEDLDLSESLNALGMDSIMFAQLRKRIGEGLGLNVPMVFLSDAFSIGEMVSNLVEQAEASEDN